MTKSSRIIDAAFGVAMFLAGILLLIIKAEYSIKIMLIMLQFGMTVRGLRTLFYYLTMARFMVGGKTVLFRGFIFLNLGALGASLVGHEAIFAAVYLAFIHAFDGLVSMLRANESRVNGARWKLKMAYGVTDMLIAAAVVIGYAVLNAPQVAAYIYAVGLMYSAVLRIASTFRRTNIVYIQ